MNLTKKHIHTIKGNNNNIDSLISVIILADKMNKYKKNNLSYLSTIKNKAIIDIQLSYIINMYKNVEVIISINKDQYDLVSYIKKTYTLHKIRFVENCSVEETNDSESLRLCLNNIYNDRVIVIKGALQFPLDSLSQIDLNKSGVIVGPPDKRFEVGVVSNEKHALDHLGFGLNNSWLEVFWINNIHCLNVLREIVSTKLYKKKFIFEAINDLVDIKNFKLHTHYINNFGEIS